MPRYSDELIEEVRSRNDIVDVISQYVRTSHTRQNTASTNAAARIGKMA